MKLKNVVLEGYRSIRDRVTLVLEPNVTVVLGPNDHGKTNLLNALQHLNGDCPYDEDDLNWDSADKPLVLPSVTGTFVLGEKETKWLFDSETAIRDQINTRIEAKANASVAGDAEDEPGDDERAVDAKPDADDDDDDDSSDNEPDEALDDADLPEQPLPLFKTNEVPTHVVLSRVGLQGNLAVQGLERFHASVREDFSTLLPRIEMIEPITKLSDSVAADELAAGKNDFMRGIFYYAGLDPDKSQSVFDQTDRNQMTVNRASEQLNKTLRESWSQGKDLSFRLTHHSRDNKIDLQIEDPSISSTYVRASRRSSGFTHYFSLKTILYARQKDHPADSYILLFDEPGVYLHPSGQSDLLQVLETLSAESQVLYVTHSLFMINKTFPSRHRLIMKTSEGTTIDGKPYVGRWQSVLNALGLTLTGSILFANHVILTEGDSDPIYIYAVIQKAVAAGKCSLDIKSLAVMSTSESRHTDVLLRLLCETQPKPSIGIIVDGDKGGEERLRYVNTFLTNHGVHKKQLIKDTAIEDYLPMLREVYVRAVAAYTGQLMVLEEKAKPDTQHLYDRFVEHFDKTHEKGKVTQGISKWAEVATHEIGGLSGKPSKVGIAREYAALLLELDDKEFKWDTRTKGLVDWMHEKVGVPQLKPVESKILD